ncbi:ankyrin repeat domain-containing protein [Parashewanella curva]|uniref:ankyrin repeat domain-containing protein n=1 Tax=Parashewanella curva TaxID=2338552 RepID=UPI0014044522|nr:ankyrin repeat domain-containing protein [Parashewanella curva]
MPGDALIPFFRNSNFKPEPAEHKRVCNYILSKVNTSKLIWDFLQELHVDSDIELPVCGYSPNNLQGLKEFLHAGHSTEVMIIANSVIHLTPLQYLCTHNQYEAAKLLLNNGADVNFKGLSDSGSNLTPIQIACFHADLNLIKLLVLCGANVFCRDNLERTLIHFAVGRTRPDGEKVIGYLTSELKIDVNSKDKLSQTPLHYAVNFNDKTAVEALIHAGSNLEIRDVLGKKPQSYLVNSSQQDIKSILSTYSLSTGWVVVEPAANKKDDQRQGSDHLHYN